MSKCYFCGNITEDIAPLGAYIHIRCDACGEYKVTFQALSVFPASISENIKGIIVGEIFENTQNNRDVFIIDSKCIQKIDINEKGRIAFKAYKLAEYCYKKTMENGLGSKIVKIPYQCCYTNSKNEYHVILEYLKEISVLSYEKSDHRDASGIACSVFSNIKMDSRAYITFERGINNLEEFERLFMNHDDKHQYITVNNENGNVAIGSNIAQHNTVGISESEIIRELLKKGIDISLIDKIRDDIKELANEINRIEIDTNKINRIFEKIKAIGGNVLVGAFSFLSRPECIGIISKMLK